MAVEDRVLVELHRAATLAGRPGVAVPSVDLDTFASQSGNRGYALKAVARLVRSGRVIAVRKDLLVLPDATGRVIVGLPELIDVVAPLPYLITGGWALQHHELTDQHFFMAVVLVPSSVTNFTYRAETTEFLLTDHQRIWGWTDDERPRYATPERAIVDALSHARYRVSFQQALTAMLRAARKDSRFMERLVVTVSRYSSAATARRVGLLVDRHFGTDAAAPFRELIGTSRTPVRLRSTGTADGPVDRAWRVRVNVSTEVEAAT